MWYDWIYDLPQDIKTSLCVTGDMPLDTELSSSVLFCYFMYGVKNRIAFYLTTHTANVTWTLIYNLFSLVGIVFQLQIIAFVFQQQEQEQFWYKN